MQDLHLLLQSLTLAQEPSHGLQQLRLQECSVAEAAAAGRDSLMHLTSLALLRMTGELYIRVYFVLFPLEVAARMIVFVTLHFRAVRPAAPAMARADLRDTGGVRRHQRRLLAAAAVARAKPLQPQPCRVPRCHCRRLCCHDVHTAVSVGDCAMRQC